MSDFQPEIFGKYFLVDKIAVGGMAEIFKAKSFGHGGFEKLLVIKRILSHLSENEDFVSMFVDEANVSVALQHANIVQTYDFGKIRDNYFIAMEHVEGKDVKAILRTLAQRRRILPIEFSVYIAHEVCKGLDYAHRRTDLRGAGLGIVHRDMSPSNVLISYEGEIKIADFGIAKAEKKTYTTKDGVLKGKFEYMSPEQASGEDTDPRSDIFSTGIILYECLTGRRLFKNESEIKTLERIRACDVDPPSILNPAIPARLDQIVLKALSRRTADRYQDAREFQHELLEFLYPATPDLTRQSFSHFLRELFGPDIAEEHRRLEEGSRVAAEMRARLPEEWDGSTSSVGTLETHPSRLPILLGVLGLVLIVGLTLFLVLKPAPEPITLPPPPTPTTGSLEIRVQVPARVWLDGRLAGEAAVVSLTDLEPGVDHTLKVSADGFKDFEDSFSLAAGDQLRMPIRLVEVGSDLPPPVVNAEKTNPNQGGNAQSPPSDAKSPPKVNFRSTPSGADVFVNGQRVGRTPLSWTQGNAGEKVSVEYRMEGHASVRFEEQVPEPGQSDSVSHTLQAVASEPGRLSVNVSRGWANVYIDGRKLAETTPLANHALPPGEHTIRVSNPELGIEQSRKITVRSGASERVSFTVD